MKCYFCDAEAVDATAARAHLAGCVAAEAVGPDLWTSEGPTAALGDWVVVDLETAGPQDADPGAERYVREARVICAVGWRPPGSLQAWVPGMPAGEYEWASDRGACPQTVHADAAAFTVALDAGRPVPWVAHNAVGFDARVWAARGLPPPAAGWRDSVPAARRLGFPGKLDALSRRMLGDQAGGKRGADSLKAYRQALLPATGSLLADIEPEAGDALSRARDRVLAYCVRDVVLLWQCLVAGVADEILRGEASVEGRVWAADLAVQARGFALDRDLATSLAGLDGALLQLRRAAAARAGLDDAGLRSVPRLRAWLAAQGYEVRDAQRATLEALYENAEGLPPEVEAVLDARLAETRIHRSKLAAALEEASDGEGRVRRWGRYHAAHTGRWGGAGFQPHNLPRPVLRGARQVAGYAAARAGDLAALEALAREVGCDPSDALAGLLRGVVVASPGKALVVADYAQVEARVLLWLAEDVAGLAEFERGDPYATMIAAVDSRPPPTSKEDPRRQLGKVMVLACGFGMGAARFAAHARVHSVDLAAVGVTAEAAVAAYRRARPRVVALWHATEAAWAGAFERGATARLGPVTIHPAGDAVAVDLPSGRRLWYREPRRGPDGRLFYRTAKGPRLKVWGGLLVENIVQAIARDLLAGSLVAAEAAGLAVVLHVHDELVVEAPTAVSEATAVTLQRAMLAAPSWSAGRLPLKVETRIAERWA